VEVVASLSQGRTAAAHCGLFAYKSVPVIFEPPCTIRNDLSFVSWKYTYSLGLLHSDTSSPSYAGGQVDAPHRMK